MVLQASDAYAAADISNSYVDVSKTQPPAYQPQPAAQQNTAAALNRSAPLRAVRPSAAALSPLSLRQAAQQQHWLRHQEINHQSEDRKPGHIAAYVPRVPTDPSLAHHEMHLRQQQLDQQSLPQYTSAAEAVSVSSTAAQPRLLPPNAEDLVAYEQANHMLKRLHFERMQRQPVAASNCGT